MDVSYKEAYAINPEQARMKLVETCFACGSIAETARRWHTSRNLVRKWVRHFEEKGLPGLQDRSRRPRSSPSQTPEEIEAKVREARERTGYGRKRLSWYLWQEEGLLLSPHTIRHILRRLGYTDRRKRRKAFYPAHWAWEEERPFALVQVDVKDILDKGTLGTKLWDHIRKKGLPRYHWTFLEGRTRLRFLAWSRERFLTLAMFWLRAFGIEGEVALQTDWGKQSGETGASPKEILHAPWGTAGENPFGK